MTAAAPAMATPSIYENTTGERERGREKRFFATRRKGREKESLRRERESERARE